MSRRTLGIIGIIIIVVAIAGGYYYYSVYLQPGVPTEPSSELIAAAREEGKVVVYSVYSSDPHNAWHDAFVTKYGVNIEYVSLRPADLTARFLEEERLGQHTADVVINIELHMLNYIQEGVLQPYKGPGWNALPDNLKDPDGYAAAIVYLISSVVYNPTLVPDAEAPRWEDLADPKWKGKLIMHDPRAMGFGLASFMAMRREAPETFDQEYWKAVAENEPNYQRSAAGLTQMVAMREGTVGVGGSAINEVVFPDWEIATKHDDYVTIIFDWVMISAHAQNINAAKLYADFLLSEECQSIIPPGTTIQQNPPTNPNVKWGDIDVSEWLDTFKVTQIDVPTLKTIDPEEEVALWEQWVGLES